MLVFPLSMKKGKRNGLREQLKHFYFSMQLQGMEKSKCPISWMEAFYMLAKHLEPINDDNRRINCILKLFKYCFDEE